VDKESDGRLGYIYLRQFDTDVLEDFEGQLTRFARGKNALLLDLRDNLGGAAHDRLLQALTGHTYAQRQPRIGLSGNDPRRSYRGKIFLLVNEGTSSDAEIFSHGFRELGLGVILGTPTYGAVIGTEHYTLADGSSLALPTIGWFSAEGENFEGRGIQPDILLERNLTVDEKGNDSLLRRALEYINESLADGN
jgi:tricorn protease